MFLTYLLQGDPLLLKGKELSYILFISTQRYDII